MEFGDANQRYLQTLEMVAMCQKITQTSPPATNNHNSFKVPSIPSTRHSDAQFKQQQVVFITYAVLA